MKILITGGTGLIGRGLVHRWQATHTLYVLSRSQQKVKAHFADSVTALTDLAMVDFNQLDAVINLAGEPIADKRWTAQQKHKLCHSRWDLTQQLVSAIQAAKTPPAVFISGSAIGVYGRQQASLITEEFDHYHHEFTNHLCHKWEQIALQAGSEHTRVCLLRTGVVLKKQAGALHKMLLPFKFGLGGRVGSGEQYMSWIHHDDMLACIEFLLMQPTLSGVFNATAPTPVTNTEFSQTLANVLRRPAILPMPAVALKLLLGEMADLLLTGQRVIPANLTKAGFEFNFPTLEPALHNLLQS